MSVEEVIAGALDDLCKTMPAIAQSVIMKGYFITRIKIHKEPIKINGVYRQSEDQMVIVDFQNKMIYDQNAFIAHSQSLYNLFNGVTRWYEC